MKGAFYIAKDMGFITGDYLDSSLALIEKYGLDYKIEPSIKIESLIDAMLLDKKVLSKKVRFILPVDEANVEIFSDIDKNILSSALDRLY